MINNLKLTAPNFKRVYGALRNSFKILNFKKTKPKHNIMFILKNDKRKIN